jgi:hypothetical protein
MVDHKMEWLASLGYEVLFRRNGWIECLLLHEQERWFGTGQNEREAFANALASALPSEAARRGVEAAIHTAHAATAQDAAAAPRGGESTPDHGLLVTESSSLDAKPAVPRDPTSSAEDPERADEVEVTPDEDPPHDQVDRSAPTVAVQAASHPPAAGPAAASTPLSLPAGRARPSIDVTAGHAELEELEAAIRANYVEASLLEPQRQRLLLTQWMARGRAIEVALPTDASIHARVYRLAQELGKLSKVWWPGAVRILAKGSNPWDCRTDVGLGTGDRAEDWSTVEIAAATEFERIEDLATRTGRDEFGWRDGTALYPGPDDPGALFKEVRATIEACTQPNLQRPDEAVHTDQLRPAIRRQDQVKSTNWADIAGKVRWLRGSVHDMELWGAAIGRLRWLAQNELVVDRPFERLLDPEFVPAASWRRHLGIERRRLEQSRDTLLAHPPGHHGTEQELIDWLTQAFDLGEALPIDRLAEHIGPHHARILALQAAQFGERKQRRKLHRLQALLGTTPHAVRIAAPIPPVCTDPQLPVDEPAVSKPREEQLAEQLRPLLRGARVLFVSNRSDPERDRRLAALLELAEVDGCVHDPGRVNAKADSVRAGNYNFVLAATGFLPHSTDKTLKDACRLSGTRYIRVNRGRPLQCLVHLVRELGLRTGARG